MRTREEIRDWLLDNAVDEDGDLMLDYLDFSDFAGDVYIRCMKVQGDLYQNYHTVQGGLVQSNQEVQGSLFQGGQEVQGDLYHGNSKYGGELIEDPYSKLLKEITIEELSEMGYELKL